MGFSSCKSHNKPQHGLVLGNDHGTPANRPKLFSTAIPIQLLVSSSY
jgi:hypothetical protein